MRFIIGEMLRKYIEQFSDRKLRIDWRVANVQFQLNEVAHALCFTTNSMRTLVQLWNLLFIPRCAQCNSLTGIA